RHYAAWPVRPGSAGRPRCRANLLAIHPSNSHGRTPRPVRQESVREPWPEPPLAFRPRLRTLHRKEVRTRQSRNTGSCCPPCRIAGKLAVIPFAFSAKSVGNVAEGELRHIERPSSPFERGKDFEKV